MNKLLSRPYLPALRVIFKPFDSFELLKEKNYGALWQPAVIVLLLFLTRVFKLVFGGFLFNMTDISQVNLPIEFATVVCIYILFVFANKNFCDLADGDGTMTDVALVTAYALLPYIICSLANIVLSNIFVAREQAFMGIISTVGFLWSALVGLVGLKSVHRYSFGKTVLTVFITVLFMALIAFLLAILFLITQQLIIFVKDIYSEIVFRM